MLGSVYAELLKLGKRPASWVLLGVWMVLYLLFSYAIPYTTALTEGGARALAPALPDQLVINGIGGLPIFGGAVALIFGALSVGSEYGWGTVKTLLTQAHTRLGFLGAKLSSLAVAMLAVTAVTFVVGASVSAAIAAAESAPMSWPGPVELTQGIGAFFLIALMWCLFGAALGFLVRGVALPIGLGVVWILGIENLLSNVADQLLTALRPIRDVLPAANAGSLVAALSEAEAGEPPPGVISAVSAPQATVTLVVYAVGFLVICAVLMRRRDVT